MSEAVSQHHVAGLSFDEARIQARRSTLGASEIAAVAGLNPHRTALDVWCEKRGLAEPFTGNEFTEWGLRLESLIAAKYAEIMNVDLSTSETLVCPTAEWMSATPDRIVTPHGDGFHTTWGLECKNKSARQAIHWGETATDEIPHDVAAQCHWSMLVTELPYWDVAVLFGGNQFRHYRLHANADIAGALHEAGRGFWFDHVVADVQPEIDGSKAAAEYLKKRFTSHTELVREATNEETRLVFDLRGVREQLSTLEEQEALHVNQLKEAIGDCAGIVCRGGRVTWKAPKPTTTTDWKAVAIALGADDTIVAKHTTQKENSRRFLLTIPKE